MGRVLCKKWRLVRVLGRGGMSTVFAAVHRNGKRVAVKVLHPDLALDARRKLRFLREGYIANRVEHPGAVSVLDDDTDVDGTSFLVMELLEGETVSERQARSKTKLSLPEALVVAHKTLDVLHAAHRLGIVHRDVKPGNIFLTTDRTLKLLDFGIARVNELPELGADATRTGATLGTPAFMAPEQARARSDEIDARTDLYAVAATLFSLITGRHVHERATSNELMIASATVPASSLAALLPDAPTALVELVDRGLRLDREQRWQDAQSMQQAVERAWKELHLGGSPADHPLPEIAVEPQKSHDTSETVPASIASVAGVASVSSGAARGSKNLKALSVLGVVAAAAALAVAIGRNGSAPRDDSPREVAASSVAGEEPAVVAPAPPAQSISPPPTPSTAQPPAAASSSPARGSPKSGSAKRAARPGAPPAAASASAAPVPAPPGDFLDRRE